MSEPKYKAGTFVWYMGRLSFVKNQILAVIPGFYEFENEVKIEQERCFLTHEELAKSIKEEKNGRSRCK